MDRETALSIYKKIMATFEEAYMKCVDVSESIETQGLTPLYELHVKHGNPETLKAIVEKIVGENILVTRTEEGVYTI